MKFTTLFLLLTAGTLAGCSTTANNANTTTNANLRGTNTNTGYVANSDTNAKPAMPTNPTNISPEHLPTVSSNTVNSNTRPTVNTNANISKTNTSKNVNH